MHHTRRVSGKHVSQIVESKKSFAVSVTASATAKHTSLLSHLSPNRWWKERRKEMILSEWHNRSCFKKLIHPTNVNLPLVQCLAIEFCRLLSIFAGWRGGNKRQLAISGEKLQSDGKSRYTNSNYLKDAWKWCVLDSIWERLWATGDIWIHNVRLLQLLLGSKWLGWQGMNVVRWQIAGGKKNTEMTAGHGSHVSAHTEHTAQWMYFHTVWIYRYIYIIFFFSRPLK